MEKDYNKLFEELKKLHSDLSYLKTLEYFLSSKNDIDSVKIVRKLISAKDNDMRLTLKEINKL